MAVLIAAEPRGMLAVRNQDMDVRYLLQQSCGATMPGEGPEMISKSGTYGIRAMLALAKLPAGECAGAPRLAELVEVPPSYLSKLLQILAKAGLVRSLRGVSGGFCLARDAKAISLYDIVAPLEPMQRWHGCFLGNAVCSEETACAVHTRWKRVQKAYLGMLQRSTLAELARREPLTEQQIEKILS